jgi:IS30 family transposase
MEKTGYTQLTPEERYYIDAFRKDGSFPAQIARELNRSRSTLSSAPFRGL